MGSVIVRSYCTHFTVVLVDPQIKVPSIEVGIRDQMTHQNWNGIKYEVAEAGMNLFRCKVAQATD